MTLCNMSIEAGARAGMIAPDETTFRYLKGRRFSPTGADWDRAVAEWRSLATDPGASFDRELVLHAEDLAPFVTWGTNPGMVVPVTDRVPDPASSHSAAERRAWERALEYMALEPGKAIEELAIDRVFIGSCTNARIEDLALRGQSSQRISRSSPGARDGRSRIAAGEEAGRRRGSG